MNYLVSKMGLGQAEQNCRLCVNMFSYFLLHCAATWHQPGLSIVNQFQKSLSSIHRYDCSIEDQDEFLCVDHVALELSTEINSFCLLSQDFRV